MRDGPSDAVLRRSGLTAMLFSVAGVASYSKDRKMVSDGTIEYQKR